MEKESMVAIDAEAKRIEEAAKYSSETQFEYAKSWRRIDRLLSAVAASVAAVAGAGSLTDVFSLKAAGVIMLCSAGIGAVAASINAPQTKEKAAGSANSYRALQQDVRIFRRVELSSLDTEEAQQQLDGLVSRHQELNKAAEIPSGRAWKKAKKQIEAGSQEYEVDN